MRETPEVKQKKNESDFDFVFRVRDSESNNLKGLFNTISPKEWEQILNHMFEIVEGKFEYETYEDQYYFEYKALDTMALFIRGGAPFYNKIEGDPKEEDYNYVKFKLNGEGGKKLKVFHGTPNIPSELIPLWIETFERLKKVKARTPGVEHFRRDFIKEFEENDIYKLHDYVQKNGFEPIRKQWQKDIQEARELYHKGAKKESKRSDLRVAPLKEIVGPLLPVILGDEQSEAKIAGISQSLTQAIRAATPSEQRLLLGSLRAATHELLLKSERFWRPQAFASEILGTKPILKSHLIQNFVESGSVFQTLEFIAKKNASDFKQTVFPSESIFKENELVSLVIHGALLSTYGVHSKGLQSVLEKTIEKGYFIIPHDGRGRRHSDLSRRVAFYLQRIIRDPQLKSRIRPVRYVPDSEDLVPYSVIAKKIPGESVSTSLEEENSPRKRTVILWDSNEATLDFTKRQGKSETAFNIQPEVLEVLSLGEVVSILFALSLVPARLRRFYEEQLGLSRDPQNQMVRVGKSFLNKLVQLAEVSRTIAAAA